MWGQRWELSHQAWLVFAECADKHALPGFTLARQEDLVVAIDHDRAAPKPGLEKKRRVA